MSEKATESTLPAFKTAEEYLQSSLDMGAEYLDAKDFYELLGVKSSFTDWRKEMSSYGFEDEDDFHWLRGLDPNEAPAYLLTVESAILFLKIHSSKPTADNKQPFLKAKILEIMALTAAGKVQDDNTVVLTGYEMIAIKEALRALLLTVH